MLTTSTWLSPAAAKHQMFLLQSLPKRSCARVIRAAVQLSGGGQRLGDRAWIHFSLTPDSFMSAPGLGGGLGPGYPGGPRGHPQHGGRSTGDMGRQEQSGADGSGQLVIEAGGGPRTFPGGVTKWQWKRMQEKKAQTVERARLMREREAFEAQRREQLRLISGPEKPWEDSRPIRPPVVSMPRVPDEIVERFDQSEKAEDLWNENDGPATFLREDGQVSARFLPPNAVYSTAGYQRVEGEEVSRERGGNGNGNGPSVSRNAKRNRAANPMGQPSQKGQNSPGGRRTFTSSSLMAAPRVSTNQGQSSSMQQQAKQQVDPPWESAGVLDEFEQPAVVPARNTRPRGSDGVASTGVMEREPKTGGAQTEHQVASPGGSGADPSFMSQVRFDSFPLSRNSIRALHEDLGYQVCTVVQAETMPRILSGRDVLAKAKTGTGKTIAFLLPALEALLQAEASQRKPAGSSCQIRTLVICPARELATQVAEEAKQLLRHHPGCGAQLVIGGTRMPAEAARLAKQPCQVLVGTPGRLLDHIQSTHGVRQQLQGLQTLVLDECDQLLDMGFRKTLDGILGALPRKRQTLLFSATLPKEVHAMAKVALKEDHDFIDTVGEETTTNVQVRQEKAVVALEKQLPAVYSLLLNHMAQEPQFKVLVFATTARQTQLMAELFRVLGVNALEIHSRKSQAQRTKVSDQFRQSKGGVVMFTSDVSARGVDYPDVTLVVQVGVPSDKAQYIHRLGRTGRAGKEGRGVLLLSPWESFFFNQLRDLPLVDCSMPPYDAHVDSKVQAALQRVQEDTKEKAYQSWLGYYNSVKGLKWDKKTLVEHANFYSETLGLEEPPALMKKTVGMMGLRGVPGLNVK